MEDNDLLNSEMPDLAAYGAEGQDTPAKAEPKYVTEEALSAFGENMAAKIEAMLMPAKPAQTDEPDWETTFQNKAADVATARLMEMSKGQFASQIVNDVASEFPKNVQDKVREVINKYNGQQVALITQNPGDLEHLAYLAAGIHAKLNPGVKVQAPRSSSSGTVNPEASVDSARVDELMLHFGDIPGYTRKVAEDIARGKK